MNWKAALRGRLTEAMRAKNAEAVSVLRETLAAIDHAEAVPAPAAPVSDGPIAGATMGLGSTEVPRRALSLEEVEAVIAREQEERRTAIATWHATNRPDEAARLERQLALIESIRAELNR